MTKKQSEYCQCIAATNKFLSKNYPGIYVAEVTNLTTGKHKCQIKVERRHGKEKIPLLVAAYCPVCGKKYEDENEKQLRDQKTPDRNRQIKRQKEKRRG
jgi:DNA repair exonuclease SbcCD ATPase subunit